MGKRRGTCGCESFCTRSDSKECIFGDRKGVRCISGTKSLHVLHLPVSDDGYGHPRHRKLFARHCAIDEGFQSILWPAVSSAAKVCLQLSLNTEEEKGEYEHYRASENNRHSARADALRISGLE